MGTTADEEDDADDETRDPPGAHSMQRTDVAAKGTPVRNPLDGATHTSRDPGRTEPLPLPRHQPSPSSLSSDHQRAAAPILLTLKPSKPLRPHDRSDVTTTDAEEDENKTRHTPTAAPARGTPRLVSEKKKRERRAHAPIPGDTPQTFAHLVLPHALVPRAPSSGGHNGQKYAQDVLLFNLVTLEWETKPIHGVPPAGRGYHITVLHDSRLIISGGYDGHTHFGDLHALELASCAYLPQVTAFEVDEKSARAIPDEPADAVPPQPSRI
ncbi:hypothetical protein NliqN6_5002 [Naganishia liquefaciens]|uniref:Galactose oxidase n=1 Tax=Naganishia liquefaciens TaxID=104408 RepID=A0A8H3YG98_9TREE|nr:hypothetical protein NliqN6_5002 [Naganishia liquefaciens]